MSRDTKPKKPEPPKPEVRRPEVKERRALGLGLDALLPAARGVELHTEVEVIGE